MIEGHCSLQLGVPGAVSLPAGPGRGPGGVQGLTPPEALNNLFFTVSEIALKTIYSVGPLVLEIVFYNT